MLLDDFLLTGTRGQEPAPDAAWVPVPVPGGVHEALVAAGTIPHPYVTADDADVAWVEERTWWYRTHVVLPPVAGRTVLRFEGLDGVATVLLDGAVLGTHANQHRPAEFDVTGSPPGTPLELLVRFSPPLAGLLTPGELDARLETLREQVRRVRPRAEPPSRDDLALRLQRTRRRKAACSWGWDLGPRLPSIGLHRPVAVLQRGADALTGVHARTVRLDDDAVLGVGVALDLTGPARLRLTLADPDGDVVAVWEGDAAPSVEAELHVAAARPWWPHDLGEQPRYALHTALLRDGAVLDARTERVGLRTVALDRSPDPASPGRLFRLVVNGVPVFVRGANWVPASLLVGSVPAERYRALVAAARHGGMTMLRVWGGGLYEHDAFYEACDDLGVLVWQDFMFACDDYPSGDAALTQEVRAEAVHQVQRLRNHPSLALWAGNNEVQGIHEIVHGDVAPGGWGWSWFHELLPAVVEQHSPGAVYWPGSPWGEDPDETVNGVRDGDRHAWEVWHGVDVGAGTHEEYATPGEAAHWSRYAHDTGRFISEFGIHAAPELATLERWSAAPLELGGAALEHRNKDTPKDKGWALMELETGVPSTVEEYVDRSMACQAEGLKLAVEHYRRRQPSCSGVLVWQFNDVWPGLSWSVLDHDLVGKAGYFFLQRAFAPVVVSLVARDGHLALWATNSSRTDVALDLAVTVGAVRADRLVDRVRCVSTASSSRPVWTTRLDPADELATVTDARGAVPANRLFLRRLQDLPLDGQVRGRARRTGPTSAEVVLTATGHAYLAHVRTGVPGAVLSTNHLDLRDGQTAVVTVTALPEDHDVARLQVASYGSPARPVEVDASAS